jgi:hypothetical protein
MEGIVRSRADVMAALAALARLGLPDAWVGAGMLRNAAWDALHGFAPSPPTDVDVVWRDPSDPSRETERGVEAALAALEPGLPWQARNQARMHERNGDAPYRSTADAAARWPETATAVLARLGADGRLEVAAPWGLDDLVGLVLRRTPGAPAALFARRVAEKRWLERWPGLRLAAG